MPRYVLTQTWQKDMEQKTNKTGRTLVSHWSRDLNHVDVFFFWEEMRVSEICDSDAPMEIHLGADRTSFFTCPCWTQKNMERWHIFSKSHKNGSQRTDDASLHHLFQVLGGLFKPHLDQVFVATPSSIPTPATAFDFRTDRPFRCVLVDFKNS